MARNKYPEETVEKILEIAGRLFWTKGYEQTSIQDIVDELGMSKGAIYHHFKNKEQILNQLCDSYYNRMDWFTDIPQDKSLNGREKLRKLFWYSLCNEQKLQVDQLLLPMLQNPRMVAAQLRDTVQVNAPLIARIIQEGNEDGSLAVDQPEELAEIVMLLTNLWINPGVFCWTPEEFQRRVLLLATICQQNGLPIVDEEMLQKADQYYAAVSPQRQ